MLRLDLPLIKVKSAKTRTNTFKYFCFELYSFLCSDVWSHRPMLDFIYSLPTLVMFALIRLCGQFIVLHWGPSGLHSGSLTFFCLH